MTLDELIHRFMISDSGEGLEEIGKYLGRLPRNEDSKNELLEAIDSYDLEMLYQTLFDDFFELLSDEESLKYFNKYLATFESAPDLRQKINDSINSKKQKRLIDEALPLSEEEATFVVIDENGKELTCTTLFTFDHAGNGNHYVVYTDYSRDENGVFRVFAAIKNKDGSLAPIKTDEEWNLIEYALTQTKKEI